MDKNEYNTLGYSVNQRKIGVSPFILYTIVTFSIYVLPYMKVSMPYIISGTLMLAFLPIAMLKKREWMNYAVLLLALSGMVFLFDISGGEYSFIESANEAIRNIRFFLPALWTMYALENCSVKRYKHFMACFAAVIGVILVKTLDALEKDQWIARVLAKDKMQDTPEIRAYRLQNVGGFEFAYVMGIVTICLVWTAIKVKNNVVRIICVCASVASFYYIIQTMYTTLLLLTAIAVLILLVLNIKNPFVKIAVIIVFGVFSLSLASFFETLSGVFTDSLLSTKFMQLHDALTEGDIGALGSRPEHILDALNNWLHSPIIGGYNVSNKNHSTIIGVLERNGLVGLFSYVFLFYKSWKLLKNKLHSVGSNQLLLNVVCIYLFVLSFFNPIGYIFELTMVAFFVTPLWIVLLESRGDK